jgi:hypothetical protein
MHPFDNEPFPDASSWFSHVRESCGPRPSKNYFQAEARLKERIVSGKVDFQPCIWDKYLDGMLCIFFMCVGHDPSMSLSSKVLGHRTSNARSPRTCYSVFCIGQQVDSVRVEGTV